MTPTWESVIIKLLQNKKEEELQMARSNENELNLDELELELEEDAAVVEEKAPKKEKKAKKAKKEKPEKEKVESKYISANKLAEELGTNGQNFRSWLRTQFPQHPKGTSWKWEKDSKELQELVDAWNAYRAGIKDKPATKETTPEVEIDI